MEKIELKEFVRKVIADIEDEIEIGKRSLDGPIKFEVSVIKTEKLGGNLKIFVASVGGGIEKESVAKISFEVNPLFAGLPTMDGKLRIRKLTVLD